MSSEAKKVVEEIKEPIKKIEKAPEKEEPRFSRQSLIGSSQFVRIERDLLRVLLSSDREYTVQEARKILDAELNREVR